MDLVPYQHTGTITPYEHYNSPGLLGFFGWLGRNLSSIGAAIGGLIGGPVGAAIGGYVGYAIGGWINGTEVKGPISYALEKIPIYTQVINENPNGLVINGLEVSPLPFAMLNELTENERDMYDWFRNDFRPWMMFIVKPLAIDDGYEHKLNNSGYRDTLNNVLKSLALAEMYYKLQENQHGLSGIMDNFEISEDNLRSKSFAIFAMRQSIREAYISALKEYLQLDASVKTVKVTNNSTLYHRPIENYNWSKNTSVNIEVFVEPGTGKAPTVATYEENGKTKGIGDTVLESKIDLEKLAEKLNSNVGKGTWGKVSYKNKEDNKATNTTVNPNTGSENNNTVGSNTGGSNTTTTGNGSSTTTPTPTPMPEPTPKPTETADKNPTQTTNQEPIKQKAKTMRFGWVLPAIGIGIWAARKKNNSKTNK